MIILSSRVLMKTFV